MTCEMYPAKRIDITRNITFLESIFSKCASIDMMTEMIIGNRIPLQLSCVDLSV